MTESGRFEGYLERLLDPRSPWWKWGAVAFCLAILAAFISETTLSKREMLADFDFLVNTLRDVHPATIEGFTEEQERIIASVSALIQEGNMSQEEFAFALNRVMTSFGDAHTVLVMQFENTGINLPMVWLSDGLYIFKDKNEFKAGDRILKIGGFTEEQLLNKLSEIVPAENKYWVKYRGMTLIRYRQVLEHLEFINAGDDEVSFTVSRSGSLKTIYVSCTDDLEYDSLTKSRRWLGYEINESDNLGYFWLDSCRYDETYQKTVEEFFQEVVTAGIDNVVLDLRRNTGGSTLVAYEFLKYLNVNDRYKCDVLTRYSKQAREQRGYSHTEGVSVNPVMIPNDSSASHKFHGNVYVLVSNMTFSSAHNFAYLLGDIESVALVGEPTGNALARYAEALRFELPNTGIRFNVSHKEFVPIEALDPPTDALYPDILVETTIEDILNGVDPQLEAVKDIIRFSKGN